MKTFVSIVTFGKYEDYDFEIVYSGVDFETAIQKGVEFMTTSEYLPIKQRYVEIWENGVKINVERFETLNNF